MSITETERPARVPLLGERPLKPVEFQLAMNMCAASYYKMRKLGFGPQETFIPGVGIRITVEVSANGRRRLKSTINPNRQRRKKRAAVRTANAPPKPQRARPSTSLRLANGPVKSGGQSESCPTPKEKKAPGPGQWRAGPMETSQASVIARRI
jgi:hypothetical protein